MNGLILFEGEYKDGQWFNGKSYEYNLDSVLEFEGEYKEGLKWNGIIEEYYWDNKEMISTKYIIEGNLIE